MSGSQDATEAARDAAPEAAADPPAPIAETSPTGLQVADAWADAADATGMVEARRDMPEPDSLGG